MIRTFALSLCMMTTACFAAPELSEESISVKSGKEFTISLESLASAGYAWEIVPSSINKHLIKRVSEDYKSPETKLIGAPGTQIFTLRARKPGVTQIIFEYKRPWENEITKRHTVHITIENTKSR